MKLPLLSTSRRVLTSVSVRSLNPPLIVTGMKRGLPRHLGAGLCLLMCTAGFALPAPADAIPAKDEASDTTRHAKDEPIQLSPFVVNAADDRGYLAASTLAGTRLKTNLRDIGSAISVITEQFLRDTAAVNSEDLLVYTLGTEIAGPRGNYTAVSVNSDRDATETSLLIRPNTNTRVRGLAAADNTRELFVSEIPWDSYNTDRIDLQRGPNSILFGLGNPSGIINGSLRQAAFKNSNSVEFRFGSYGSNRASLDLNRVLLPDELALRFDALYDNTEYEQRPAYNKDKRVYGALRYDPKFLSRGAAHTTIRLNFEAADIRANRPRTLPPTDRITPFFLTGSYVVPANPITGTPALTIPYLNRSVYNIQDAYSYNPNIPGSGSYNSGNKNIIVNGQTVINPAFQPNAREMFTTGVFTYFPDPNSAAQQTSIASVIAMPNTQQFGIGANGAIDRSVSGLPFSRLLGVSEPWAVGVLQGSPFSSGYISPSLTDPSIFNFYTQLLDGPNKLETRNFTGLNYSVSQTFFNNRVGFDVAGFMEHYRDSQDALFSDRYQAIGVDLSATLPNGAPNPNAGRPLISGATQGTGRGERGTVRQDLRGTLFAELRADDFLAKSMVTRILGRHVFTGLYSTDRFDRDSRSWARLLLDSGYGQLTGQGSAFGPRNVQTVQYIGPDLRNYTTASGLNLQAPTAYLTPTSTTATYFDSHWNKPVNPATPGYVNPAAAWTDPYSGATFTQSENPANYVGWTTYNAQILNSLTGDRDQLTSAATRNRFNIESEGFTWQGFLFDGTVVPTFGYRKDKNKIYTTNAPVTANGVADVNSPAYVFATSPRAILETQTRSWSVVVHSPSFINEHLPFGSEISLTYNHASNFNPSDVGRTDMLGRNLAPSSGETHDYGILINSFNNKLSFRVVRFETSIKDASYSWSGSFWVGSLESRAWTYAKRWQAGLSGDPLYSGAGYQYGQTVNGAFLQTDADRAKQAADATAVLAAFPTDLFAAWQIPTTKDKWEGPFADANAPWGQAPAGYTATRDTTSKGTEFELIYNPLPNWTISANASKTRATTTNNLGDLTEWIEARNAIWQGPAGDIRLFNGTPAAETMRYEWNASVWGPYQFEKYKNGTNVQEMRPWRFNVITNYSFRSGFLKDVSVGGAYRWEDKQAIGYPWTYLTIQGKQVETPDLSRPVYGPTDRTVDLWCGYSRRLSEKLRWRIQLNVRNVFGKNELVPVSVEPDGSVGVYRIKEKANWMLTNTFEF